MCFFGPPTPQLPPAPPPVPDESVSKQAKEDARVAAAKRKGLVSTNKTAGLGSGTSDDANTERKSLLG